MSVRLTIGETDVTFIIRKMPTRRISVHSVMQAHGTTFAYKKVNGDDIIYTDNYRSVMNYNAWARSDMTKMGNAGLNAAVVAFGLIPQARLDRARWWYLYNAAREQHMEDLKEADDLLKTNIGAAEIDSRACAFGLASANRKTGLKLTAQDLI